MFEPESSPLESFRICREEVKHEYDVLTGRVTTYITSQSFLVSAYAVSMNNPDTEWGPKFRFIFPILLCLAGLLLSLQAYPGISGTCEIINQWHARQTDLLARHPSLTDYVILAQPRVQWIYVRALAFARGSSWIFGTAWIVFACLTAWLYTFHGHSVK